MCISVQQRLFKVVIHFKIKEPLGLFEILKQTQTIRVCRFINLVHCFNEFLDESSSLVLLLHRLRVLRLLLVKGMQGHPENIE